MTGSESDGQEDPRSGPGLLRLLLTCAAVIVACLVGRLWLGKWAAPAGAFALLALPFLPGPDSRELLRFEPRRAALGALEGLAAAAVCIPLFFAGVGLFWRFKSFEPSAGALGRALAFNLALVAVPEEVFFRAFLQRGLTRLWGHGRRFLGGWGLYAAAGLFALTHLAAHWRPGALLVFFPGLAFGWLWARRESLAGPVIFHVACNLSLLWIEPGLF